MPELFFIGNSASIINLKMIELLIQDQMTRELLTGQRERDALSCLVSLSKLFSQPKAHPKNKTVV
jgi:hypothetical protein